MFRFPRLTSALAAAFLSGMAAWVAVAADDARVLDEYLSRLGLADLRLHHLERRLAAESDPAKRAPLAQAIVDGYAEQLVAVADEPERFANLKTRVERVLASAPQARTAALEIVLLQADYQRAEALVLQWQEEPTEADKLQQARAILTQVQPLLAVHQSTLSEAADKATDALDNIPSEPARLAAEKEVARQRTLAARAEYFAGWAAYYLGVTQAGAAATNFADAKLHFLRLLDVSDDDDYSHVEAADLALDSVWRARAVIGLALAELGLKHLAAAERIFSWLTHPAVAPTIRDQAKYWHFQGLINAQLFDAAARLATAEVNSFSSAASPGKTSLCMSAIRAGTTQAAGEQRMRLVNVGVQGLTQMRQFEALDKLIEKHDLEKLLPDDFHLLWLKGRRQYLMAEKAKDEDGFRTAAQTLTAALNSKDARQDVLGAAQVRYYLGWARYRLEEIETAAQLFREAAIALRAELPDVAVQAAWMHCTCLVKRTERDAKQAAAAVAALSAFKQDYPSSSEAQQVDLLVARLRQSHLPPEQTIRELAKIKPSDPTYVAAQVEICQLQHQLWTAAKADRGRAQPLAKDVLATAEKVLAASSAAPEQRLKAALLAFSILSTDKDADWQRVASLLDRVAGDASTLAESSAARIEFEYRRLELSQRRGDNREAQKAADWIARHGQGTPYELPALILVAQGADRATQKADASQRATKLEEARAIYERLAKLLGESKETLTANKNALAAASKLAQYDEELGRWPQAAERVERLLAALPSDRRLLRRAALAYVQAGQPAQALPHWRTLLAGLAGGSEEWFEAKYYQLVCLEKTDSASAKKVLAQFHVLYPEVKSDEWKEKFATLAQRLQ